MASIEKASYRWPDWLLPKEQVIRALYRQENDVSIPVFCLDLDWINDVVMTSAMLRDYSHLTIADGLFRKMTLSDDETNGEFAADAAMKLMGLFKVVNPAKVTMAQLVAVLPKTAEKYCPKGQQKLYPLLSGETDIDDLPKGKKFELEENRHFMFGHALATLAHPDFVFPIDAEAKQLAKWLLSFYPIHCGQIQKSFFEFGIVTSGRMTLSNRMRKNWTIDKGQEGYYFH